MQNKILTDNESFLPPLDLLHNHHPTVWVIGDIMLDSYTVGGVSRISPEAPVPIVAIKDKFSCLGGAGNVAVQLARLGSHVYLAGIIGKDPTGLFVLKQCQEYNILTSCIIRSNSRPTTLKKRILAGDRHLLRLDKESTTPINYKEQLNLISLLKNTGIPDIIVISDYNKGVLTEDFASFIMTFAKQHDIPIIVDTKNKTWNAFRHATCFTPNIKELSEVIGQDLLDISSERLISLSSFLFRDIHPLWILATRGSRGMVLIGEEESYLIPPLPVHAVDPTGAGDAVVSWLAYCLSAKMQMIVAARIANHAASITVSRIGTVSVSLEELFAANSHIHPKIMSEDGLSRQLKVWHSQNKKIVFTNGCFDLIHSGHIHLLKKAKGYGDILIVGLNSDKSISFLGKGPERPIVRENERALVVASMQYVDAVILFDDATPTKLVQRILPDTLVKGRDYLNKEIAGRDIVEKRGGQVVLVDLIPDRSTSLIISKFSKGENA